MQVLVNLRSKNMTINDDRQQKTNDSGILTDEELAAIALIDTLLPAELEEHDRIAAGHPPRRSTVEAAREWYGPVLAANRKDGHQAQARRQIDAHRKEEGKDHYNASRRGEYAGEIMSTQHRRVRPWGVPASAEKAQARRDQKKASKERARAARTEEQVVADRIADAARKKAKRDLLGA